MSKFRECTSPEEALDLAYRSLDFYIQDIASYPFPKENDEYLRGNVLCRRLKRSNDAWVMTIGHLCILTHNMTEHGHTETASQLQEILGMVMKLDFSDEELLRMSIQELGNYYQETP